MNERGWGFQLMKDKLLESELSPPVFDYVNNFFVVTFYSKKDPETGLPMDEELFQKLKPRQKEAIKILTKKGSITRNDYMTHFGISKMTALRDLNELLELGLIISEGRGAHITYKIL